MRRSWHDEGRSVLDLPLDEMRRESASAASPLDADGPALERLAELFGEVPPEEEVPPEPEAPPVVISRSTPYRRSRRVRASDRRRKKRRRGR